MDSAAQSIWKQYRRILLWQQSTCWAKSLVEHQSKAIKCNISLKVFFNYWSLYTLELPLQLILLWHISATVHWTEAHKPLPSAQRGQTGGLIHFTGWLSCSWDEGCMMPARHGEAMNHTAESPQNDLILYSLAPCDNKPLWRGSSRLDKAGLNE